MSSSTQQNGFGPAFFLHMMLKLAQGTAKAKSIFNCMVLIRLCDLAKKPISLPSFNKLFLFPKLTINLKLGYVTLQNKILTSKF
jgi:hypothetical protein